jgi:hypothetical protein
MEFGAGVEVLRVSVNAGSSLGSSGIETNLAPSMTIGTGFFGRSSLVENLEPKHFVQWTRLAYNSDPAESFGSFAGLIPWESPVGPVPAYPIASNMAGEPLAAGSVPVSGQDSGAGLGPDIALIREEIRRIVIEELAQFAGGIRG